MKPPQENAPAPGPTEDVTEPGQNGLAYWRSLEHRAQSPQLLAELEQEFPGYSSEAITEVSRRGFLKLMAASMALAGLTLGGCRRWPQRQVHPFAQGVEGMKPGQTEQYATLTHLGGVATGVLATSFDGRPIKIEGNPLHPYSLGAADAFSQASVLSLYDPDRSRTPLQRRTGRGGRTVDAFMPRSWRDFERFARAHFDELAAQRGRGLAVLCEPSASPTLLRLRQEFLERYPEASWHLWEPVHRDDEIEGTRVAFGRALRPVYRLDRAAVVACFEADLLGRHPAHQRHARDWATLRRRADQGRMNRLYCLEANYSLTGSVADRRLAAAPSRIGLCLHALAAKLNVADGPAGELNADEAALIARMAADLRQHQGRALVAVGPSQPPRMHALAHAINHALGAIGQTVRFTDEPVSDDGGCVASLRELSGSIEAGRVRTLVILGTNPAYDAPADMVPNLGRDGLTTIHLGSHFNETAARSNWHLPMAHELECWGDGRAWDGTPGVQQPLIMPLFEGRSPIELLSLLAGDKQEGLELVRRTWQAMLEGGDEDAFDRQWRKVVHDGLWAEGAWPTVDADELRPPLAPARREVEVSSDDMELLFIPDTSMHDGRFANNGWLQELPDPLTKLTWDNAALISKPDADRLGLGNGDVLAIERRDGGGNAHRLEIAAYIMPGLARGTLVLPLGYGRGRAGRIGEGVGFDTYQLRAADGQWIAPGAVAQRTGRRYRLAMTQDHHLIDAVGMWGRTTRVGEQGQSGYLIRDASLSDYRRDRHVFRRNGHGGVSLQLFEPAHPYNEPHAWGMAIDMNSCTGCSACVIACQAENNVPIVGKREVANKREMHWLRIDRYFKGPVESPDTVHVPMPCAHCENAPCEEVCPVAATVHDSEGLNVMVYNRCIGTRYCANNCPYKVRRFNYFDYHATDPRGRARPWLGIPDRQQHEGIDPVRQLGFNPDVTVRMRGVMEKCTYCTQRITAARIHAKGEAARGQREDERVRDGEVTPACAAACPTQAIVFGDLNDPESRVSKLLRGNRAYEMLEEFNLRARTRYLGKVRNPAGPTAAAAEES